MNKLLQSFGYAFKGLAYAFRSQLNFKLHCVVTALVVALGLYVQLSVAEWLWISLAIALVLAAELFNTAIEVLVDLVSPTWNDKAGKVKDVAAAAVLLIALLALAIGLFIFVPKLS
ncbi:diacylglycerol kinase family protein [Pedobacter sp. ASV12]|uniref:diacylglycerol kinase family protein n=1 Tax=Pedobacter sp. ASV12 TaxID=2795120 RepID=UPI0018EB361C|nr:diacylglycerol kinase family protein [Pedobacter sp. ASV12]